MQFAVEEALMVKLGAHERRERLQGETRANVMSAEQRVQEALVLARKRDKDRRV